MLKEVKCKYSDHPDGPCEGELKTIYARTAYHFEGIPNSPEDPNRDLILCEFHAKSYQEYWTNMWNEYYSSVGFGSGNFDYDNSQNGYDNGQISSLMDEFNDFISDPEDR